MAQVFSVTARFMRRIQVREYEPAEAELTLSAELADGESIVDAISDVFGEASAGVHSVLGLPADTTLAPRKGTALGDAAAANGTAGAQRATAAGNRKKAGQTSAASAPIVPPNTELDIPATKPVATQQAAPAKPAAQPAPATATAELDPTAPAAQAPKPVATAPAQAAQPAAGGDDATQIDLAKYVGDLVRNGRVNSVQVKAIYPTFGVQRIADLAPNQKTPFKTAVDALVANAAAAADL